MKFRKTTITDIFKIIEMIADEDLGKSREAKRRFLR